MAKGAWLIGNLILRNRVRRVEVEDKEEEEYLEGEEKAERGFRDNWIASVQSVVVWRMNE